MLYQVTITKEDTPTEIHYIHLPDNESHYGVDSRTLTVPLTAEEYLQLSFEGLYEEDATVEVNPVQAVV
jgi:hypothetical protein